MFKRRGALPSVRPRTLRVNENMSGVLLPWKYAQDIASNLCLQRAPTLFQKQLAESSYCCGAGPIKEEEGRAAATLPLEHVEKHRISLSDLMDGRRSDWGG